MKIIVAHNFYRNWGGEDQVFEDECRMLSANGHEVVRFTRHNDDFSGLRTISVAAGTVWNRPAAEAIQELVRRESAEIVHFHNWLPQISQAAFYGARRGGAAVVQTVHNYRSSCAIGVLYRDGGVCEECVGKSIGWPAIRYGCYRDSRAATVPVVAALATHRALKTADKVIDALIVLSAFARDKLGAAGLPTDKMYLKPNFVSPDPGEWPGAGGYFVYLGRLIDNKGIRVLLRAWDTIENPPLLKIAGTGPLQAEVEDAAACNPRIEYLGRVSESQVPELGGNAAATIVPSENYEGFPKTVVESFAVGTPVVASDLGSLAEIVDDGRTGFLFEAGDAEALAHLIRTKGSPELLLGLRSNARSEFVNHYGSDENYRRLMEIYEAAIERRLTD